MMQKTFSKYNLSPSLSGFVWTLLDNGYKEDIDNWNIYIPNGYNNIERELKKLKVDNPEKLILGIPGCDNIVSKRIIWNTLEKEYGREIASSLMPETYVLSNDEHMENFKKDFKEGDIYILKSAAQHKSGLVLTKNKEEILSAREKGFLIVQKYLKDVLLINKRKLNLRIYLLVTVRNGIVDVFINKSGSCIYSNKDYDSESLDFESNITSYNLDYDIYNDNPMTIKQLETHLRKNGYLEPEEIFNRIKEMSGIIIKSFQNKLGNSNLKDNLCAQLFGCDFIVDSTLKPYLLECNKGPNMRPKMGGDFKEMLEKIEILHEKESNELESFPIGYVSGNGLKVQSDFFDVLGQIKSNYKNGFEKI